MAHIGASREGTRQTAVMATEIEAERKVPHDRAETLDKILRCPCKQKVMLGKTRSRIVAPPREQGSIEEMGVRTSSDRRCDICDLALGHGGPHLIMPTVERQLWCIRSGLQTKREHPAECPQNRTWQRPDGSLASPIFSCRRFVSPAAKASTGTANSARSAGPGSTSSNRPFAIAWEFHCRSGQRRRSFPLPRSRTPPAYDRARAAVRYGDVARDLIHDFKFRDRHEGRSLFGRWLARAGARHPR